MMKRLEDDRPTTPATEAACPECSHNVDHTTPCPSGCPMCADASPTALDRFVKWMEDNGHYPHIIDDYGSPTIECAHRACLASAYNWESEHAAEYARLSSSEGSAHPEEKQRP